MLPFIVPPCCAWSQSVARYRQLARQPDSRVLFTAVRDSYELEHTQICLLLFDVQFELRDVTSSELLRSLFSMTEVPNPYVCNACSSEIVGFRYKCLQCVDYDLCDKCMASSVCVNEGHRTDHVLLRLSCTASMATTSGDEKDELVSSLSVLDGFSYFGQDVEGLGNHVGLSSVQVQRVLDR